MKDHPMWKVLGVALACLLLAASPADARSRRKAPPPPAPAHPPVWVVTDADSELVLFGSVHILPPGLAWQPAALRDALADADDIWFELPIDDAARAQTAKLARERGMLPPGQSLFKILPLEDAGRLARVAQAYNVSPAVLDRLQPWLAEVALADGVFRRAGASPAGGVEQVLAASVPPRAQRRAFETPAEQIDMLAGSDMRDQIAALQRTLTEMEESPDDFMQLVRAWLTGDLKALDREALQPLRAAAPRLFQRLVTARNIRWTEEIRARMAGSGRTVVVVGVGHLIGADGLPARLRAQGFKVTGP